MSTKKLFEKNKSLKVLSSASLNEVGTEVESERFIEAKIEDIQRFEPQIDFATASNFVRYGSAETYYTDVFHRIYSQYPYDGARSEKQRYENSSSYFDKYIFDNIYPRTTGFIRLSANGWGSKTGDFVNGYGQPTTHEYITIMGGPHTASDGMVGKPLAKTFKDSNKYDVDTRRYSNLHFDPVQGNTVEFWLKKDSWDLNKTQKEVVFDLWNGVDSTNINSYGRLRIELTSSNGPFLVTALSGTKGAAYVQLSNTVTTSSLEAWHHYAFTIKNEGSNLQIRFYKDGKLAQTVNTGSNLNEVTGGLRARLGALYTQPSGTSMANEAIGWGKMSASLDEFRFWKDSRSSKEIGKNWWTHVYGGTNTDDANVDLGVYFKFNEGITQTASIDSTVLDYSGRFSNGNWAGYPGSQGRSLDSAIVSASASVSEFKDPIVYSFHPDVSTLLEQYKLSGSLYDYTNNSSIINSLPQWILDDNEMNGGKELPRLIQIIGSYFDTLHSQISEAPKIQNISYPSSSYKPIPFADQLLNSHGVVTSDMLIDSSILEKLGTRNDNFDFTRDLDEIKNLIYINIYNNLVNIYKTKGTKESFRNLIRCFGVDEELIKINLYANNHTYEFKDNYKNTYTKTKVIDFNHPDRFDSVVYQYPETGNSDSTGIISGSQAGNRESNLPVTVEVDVIFPKKFNQSNPNYFESSFLSSSIFGVHEAMPTDDTILTWQTPDSASVQIMLVKPEANSKNGYFFVTSSDKSFGVSLSSSVYNEIYENNKWTLALKVYPKDYPVQGITAKTTAKPYLLELYGVSIFGDTVQNEFTVSASVSYNSAMNFLSVAKRVFVGSHRTNFTGAVQQQSDVRISGCRYWFSHLNDDEIKSHARDPNNFGVLRPSENAYLLKSNLSGAYVPKLSTLAMNWDFNRVTGSANSSDGSANTSDAKFAVLDISSGSTKNQNRYGWISKILNKQHTGRGDQFLPLRTNVVKTDFIYTNRQEPPDINVSSDMIRVVEDSEEFFVRDSRPIDHFFMVEKSMYSIVSDEILKFFGTITDFNNLIGEPVNRYRAEYKNMRVLRQLFFERMSNTPDLDKFLEYYKWIDQSLSMLIEQLVPASTNFSDGVQNIIESHVLERHKYRYKFPTLEMSVPDPENVILGVNELSYNWRFNHHPLPISGLEQTGSNCEWWNQRVKRSDSGASSGDSLIDGQRDNVERIITTHHSRSVPTLAQSDGTMYTSSAFVLRSLSRPYRYGVSEVQTIKGGINSHRSKKIDLTYTFTMPHGHIGTYGNPLNVISVGLIGNASASTDKILKEPDCKDTIIPNQKQRVDTLMLIGKGFNATSDYGELMKGRIGLPFSLISSSVRTGYSLHFMNGFVTGVAPVNVHNDSYGPHYEIPLQGPFAEKYVGGHQCRHIDLNYSASNKLLDDYNTRPEAWRITFGGGPDGDPGAFGIVGPDYGGPYPYTARQTAARYRGDAIKRPLNIKNIQQTTGSRPNAPTKIGNYTKNYQVLNAGGRILNSSEFVKNEGFSLPSLLKDLPKTTNINTIIAVKTGTSGNYFGRNSTSVNLLSNLYDTTTNNKITNFSSSNTIIACRFSAPGGPEVSSLGYLDLKSQEFSPYSSLPFRNLSVRQSGSGEANTIRINSIINKREGLQTLLRRHCGKFGADIQHGAVAAGNYVNTPSLHKIQRNTMRRYVDNGSTQADVVLVSKFDNAFVQRMIPRTDFQYSWLTASLGTASLNPAEYATAGAVFTGYIPYTGLITSGSTVISAVNFPTISDIEL